LSIASLSAERRQPGECGEANQGKDCAMSAITKTRYIPKDSTPITLEDVPAVVYVYPFGYNYAGIAYAGKANTAAWHYQYRDLANATAAANRWLAGMQESLRIKI